MPEQARVQQWERADRESTDWGCLRRRELDRPCFPLLTGVVSLRNGIVKKIAVITFLFGAPSRARTWDPLIESKLFSFYILLFFYLLS